MLGNHFESYFERRFIYDYFSWAGREGNILPVCKIGQQKEWCSLGEKLELDANQSVFCRGLDRIHQVCEGVKQSIQMACLRCPNSKEI